MGTCPAQSRSHQAPDRLYRMLTDSGSRYLVLQGLVTIILSYELLFGADPVLSQVTTNSLVLGFWLGVIALVMLPRTVFEAAWFGSMLVTLDTILVTAAIYLSGNARSDLYITYFVLMLLAASVRRLSHLFGLSLLLSAGYSVVLYEGILNTGAPVTGQLLGIPVLVVMTVFYGVALENTAVVQKENDSLQKDVEGLKKTEEDLVIAKAELEARIAALKSDLTKAKTDLREGQLTRQGLERQLQEAQKLEAVGRVAARIAVEFGSLFSAVGKQTGVMLAHLQQYDPLRGTVDELFKVGEQAATLTAQLIALNLEKGSDRNKVSVNAVLGDVRSMIADLLPEQIELKVMLDPQVRHIEVDREGLEIILFQLVVNARDAMPNGGRLTIEVKTIEPPVKSSGTTQIGAAVSQVEIAISDTGTGMNLDTQAHMFEPLFSTKEMNIGLGLTAVFRIVKQHGGRLSVESRPGQGTVVRLSFPAASVSDGQEESLPKSMLARGGETILLVEEDEIERKLAKSVLQRHRYHVLEAASPVEALMLTQQYQGIVHLTVSPLVMPEIGGRELARRLLDLQPTMKALFLSSYDDETIRQHRINQRFVLQQPYRQTGLIGKVREMLDAT